MESLESNEPANDVLHSDNDKMLTILAVTKGLQVYVSDIISITLQWRGKTIFCQYGYNITKKLSSNPVE